MTSHTWLGTDTSNQTHMTSHTWLGIDTSNQTHMTSHTWLGTDTSMKVEEVNCMAPSLPSSHVFKF